VVRALSIADVTTFLLRDRSLVNEARTRDALSRGRGRPSWWAFVEEWLPREKRWHGWVAVERGRLRGFVAARPRSGPRAWEITHFMLAQGEAEAGLALLNELSQAGAEHGVEKVFLRLAQDSPLLEISRRADFSTYAEERLYRGQRGEPQAQFLLDAQSIRPREKEDDFGLFQLYSHSAPASVRQAEGMTFEEWLQTQERCPKRRTGEWVWEKEGRVAGWLRSPLEGQSEIELMVHPAEEEALETLFAYGLTRSSPGSPVACLAAHFQNRLRRHLEAQGFEAVADYCLLVKPLAVRVPQPSLAPIQA
jgi:hypothetical protein